jgi:DNA-directed RNA polymerase subunit RPC12/RpoP
MLAQPSIMTLEPEYKCLDCGATGIVDVEEYNDCPYCGSKKLKKIGEKATEW